MKAPLRAFALSLLLFAGCSHTATQAKSDESSIATARSLQFVRAIVPCRTTESELRAQLGPPTRDGLLHGHRVLSWIIGHDNPVKYLAVYLDSRDVVVDVYWDVPTEIPWIPTDQCK